MHLRFYLKPVELNPGDSDSDSDWRYLHVARSDPRRIQVLIPESVGLNAALSLGDASISVEQALDRWVHDDKLYVNFLSLRRTGC
jgi:hypothetical protein